MKSRYSTILVPHDGAGASDRALDFAIGIAEASGAQIILLNVVNEVFMPAVVANFGYSKITGEKLTAATLEKELYHESRKEALIMLDKRKKKIRKAET